VISRLPEVTPERFARLATLALGALFLIVLTGAAVRLTGSGLACPDWPTCKGNVVQDNLSSHSIVEYGNRIVSGLVGIVALVAFAAALRRRPRRRDLVLLAAALPVGVAAQGVLGALTVQYGLKPGWVMSHFGLSMVILAAAVALAFRARHEPGEREPVADRLLVWPVRALLGWGAFVLFAGTVATASGPHPGSSGTGQVVDRLHFWGGHTMNQVIHWHGRASTLLGVAAVGTFFLLRRRGARPQVIRSMGIACVLMAVQGIVGAIQYETGLPTELVWIHVGLATATWLALLWTTAEAGTPAPEALRQRERLPVTQRA
jgi:cytochrome c oxidase assembly protein subunit 15